MIARNIGDINDLKFPWHSPTNMCTGWFASLGYLPNIPLSYVLFNKPIVSSKAHSGVKRVRVLLGGSSQLVSIVSNYGDRKSPRPGVVGPLPNGHSWLTNGGDPNYLLNGMILQQGGPLLFIIGVITPISRVIAPVTHFYKAISRDFNSIYNQYSIGPILYPVTWYILHYPVPFLPSASKFHL